MSAQEETTPKVDGPEKTNEDGKPEQQKSTEEEIGKKGKKSLDILFI